MKALLFCSIVMMVADFSCHRDRNFQLHNQHGNTGNIFTEDVRDTIVGKYYGSGDWKVNGVSTAIKDSILISKYGADSILLQSLHDTLFYMTFYFPPADENKSIYTLTGYTLGYKGSGDKQCTIDAHFKDRKSDMDIYENINLPGYTDSGSLFVRKIQ